MCICGTYIKIFETTEFVRDLLNETQAVVYEIDIKRYTNKKKKIGGINVIIFVLV